MKKKRNIIIGVIILIILIISLTVYFLLKGEDVKSDGLRFKEEYESLNDTIRESDGQKYNNLEIESDNPIVYVSPKEASEIIEKQSGVIYIGANWCPWCRNAIPVLFEAAEKNNVNKIYYVDLTEYRNVWEIINGELVKTQEEKEGYYDLLNSLDEVLEENTYKIKDKDGKEFDTNEKRIYMPMVISIKGGKIVKTHVGTVSLNENQDKYSYLTDKQKNELFNIYDELIKLSISDGKCGIDACD